MKAAYVSPMPPERSGIADYSALLLPALRERLDIVAVRRGARRLPRGVDVAVYHIGNNPEAHGWILDLMRRHRDAVPALVVLHDFVLHHLVAGVTVGRGDSEAYRAAMQTEAGTIGRLLAHAVIDGLVPPLWEVRAQDFPLVGAVLELSDHTVVHSRFVEERIRETAYAGPISRIPMPIWRDPPTEPDAALAALDASVVIGSIGYLNPSKRIPQLLAAFARLHESHPGAALVLAGASRGLDLDGALAQHRLQPGRDVVRIDYVPEERLWSLLSSLDVAVSLRWPTMGETSAIALRALAVGRPLVVSAVGWFLELPDEVAAKAPVGEGEVDALERILTGLVEDADGRRRMGESGREFVRREHDPERSADLYLAAIEETAGGRAVANVVLREVAQASHDVGVDAYGREAGEVGRAAREVGLGG